MKQKFESFLNYFTLFIAVFFVQAVDYLYFEYLHKGLKFPDYFPIMFLIIFVTWKFIIKKDVKELVGIKINDREQIKYNFIEGFKYGLIVVAVALIIGLLSSEIKYNFNGEYLKNIIFMSFGYLIFIPISALYEELHYRGIYLQVFDQRYLKYMALIISSIIFSYVHSYLLGTYSIYYPINILLIGLVLSLLRIRKNNLIVCVGFHSAWNLFLIILSPLFNDYSERYLEFTVTTTIVLFLVLLYEIYQNSESSFS